MKYKTWIVCEESTNAEAFVAALIEGNLTVSSLSTTGKLVSRAENAPSFLLLMNIISDLPGEDDVIKLIRKIATDLKIQFHLILVMNAQGTSRWFNCNIKE